MNLNSKVSFKQLFTEECDCFNKYKQVGKMKDGGKTIQVHQIHGTAVTVKTEVEEDGDTAKYYVDSELVADTKFGGAGTTEIKFIDSKRVLDALGDLVFTYGKLK